MSSINSTSSSSSGSSNSIYKTGSRVTGLFSNLDTDSIVKGLTSIQQAKIDGVKEKQTKQEWLGDALGSIKSELNDFMKNYLSATGSGSMLRSATYASFKAVTASTAGSVNVTPANTADSGRITVQINRLAKNASVESSGKVSRTGTEISANNTAKLSELDLAKKLTFGADGNITFAINGKTFAFSKDTTLQTMINTVNSDKTANVTMKYSRLSDTFTVTADTGGADSRVTITNYSGNAFGADSAFGIISGEYKNGADAEAVINGVTVTRDSNNFTIDGVSYELVKVTKDTSEETVDFSLQRDYSNTVEAVSKFINSYNTLLSKLKGLLSEQDFSADYPPLTDDQKAEMSSEQVTAWEKKAKSGLLRKNNDLQSLINKLQSSFYSVIGGTGKKASEIGITTAGYFDADAGQLVLNETKLSEALQNSPDMVISMFTNGSSTSSSAEQGLMYKIRSALSGYTSLVTTSIETGSTKITEYGEQIKEMEKKLSSLADRHYAKFSNMETALSKLNSQSTMISQMFGGGI